MAEFLTQSERATVRQYLGYFNLETRYAISANQPLAVPGQEILEQNMRNILDEYSLEIVREIITEIKEIRCQISEARRRLKVSKIANTLTTNRYEISMLWDQDWSFCSQLAKLLAVQVYSHPTGRGVTDSGSGSGGYIPIRDNF